MLRFRRSLPIILFACTAAAAACSRGRAPVAAGVFVAVSRDTLPVGAPIDVTLQFSAARNAADLPKDGRVLLRILFADGEVMANYDHDPEPPTSKWQPGATIRYTKRIFVRNVAYSGAATLVVGLLSKETGKTVPMTGDDLGGRMYRAASLTLRPAPSIVTYGDGWYRAEGSAEQGEEWRWTAEQASMSMRNPQRDSVLYLRVGGGPMPADSPQQLTIEKDGKTLRQIEVKSAPADYELPMSATELGTGTDVKLLLKVDKTFVPAKLTGGGDSRTLGVRVFNAFLEPKTP
jgi:hypothetical protein